jgi:flagellar hook-associated protein 3 FlgL
MRISGTSLLRNEQFRRNIGEGITWLTVTEDAIADGIDAVQRLRELAIYSSNGTMSPEDRETIAPEVKELLQHLVSLGNTEMGGLYIFGGHQTQDPPYELITDEVTGNITGILYHGDGGQRMVEITPGQMLAINITGEGVFGGSDDPDTPSLFKAVSDMHEALLDDNSEALGGEILQELDGYLDRLLQYRAEIGAKTVRLNSTEERLLGEHLHLQELRSKIEDIDLAELYIEFTMQENAYHAALSTGARIIFPSLIDFLR